MTQIISGGKGGGGGKIGDYVADVPYECWEGESKAISGDKVYAKVSAMDTTLNTALQPGDNVSELCNDAGYIDKTVSDLCNYSQTCDFGCVAFTNCYDDLSGVPTIGDGTLTISKNGTQINTFTANQSSNVGVDIEVPTDTSDLTNGAGFIDNTVSDLCCYTLSGDLCTVATSGQYCDLSGTPSLCAVATSGQYCDLSGTPDLSGYQTTSNMVTTLSGADDTHYPTAKTVADALACAGAGDMLKSVYDPNNCNADAFNYDNFYNKPAIIDSLCCTSTTDALSANQGKALKDLIDTYVGLGRFLSLWNASTGQPISFPLSTPYTYNTGDWFMVEVTGTTNYMPNGSSYTGAASTTVDSTNNVEVRDVYIYDGTDWLFQKNNEVQVSFSDIAGVPNDNACLCSALAAKADTSSLCTVATSGKYCDLTGQPTIPTNNNQLTNGCGYTTCTGTLVASDLTPYAKSCTLCAVATSGKYCDLTGTPALCTVATSGKYCDLTGQPTIGTATLTIQRNGTTVNTFGANATSNVTANISVPTDTCELSNGAGFITIASVPTNNNQLTNGCGYTTCTGTLTASNISDEAYASSWNGVTTVAPSKNAVYDKISTMCIVPSGGTEGQVLTKTDSGCAWCDAGGGGGMCMDIFVVGGGGRGNYGGGGGGGVIEEYRVNLGGNSICVKIGEGGYSGWNGGDSCVGCCIAYGGGSPGTDGGSGGGGGYGSASGTVQGGLGIKGQGFNGGDGVKVSDQCLAGGGGGGAGGPGRTNIYYITNGQIGKYGGHGGPGIATYFFGDKRCFGGGGGGGGTGGIGCGGLGGGGDGYSSGTANTGGGGGGGRACGGGSGIAGIRYPADGSYGFSCATGGTVTTCTIGGVSYKIHTFTSDGTFTIVS